MKKTPDSPSKIEKKVLGRRLTELATAFLLLFNLNACHPNQRKIEGQLSDTESELLTRGDNQREINKEGNIYVGHMGGGDEEEISKMEEGTSKRAQKNRKEYKKLLKKRNRLQKKRDEAIANGASHHHSDTYDEHEFENSDDAIRQSIANRR